MERNSSCVLTNMCMVEDEIGRVLVQQRVDKNWSGIAFPGGHVEPGESLTESVIREVKEETGLTIKNVKLCGVKDWCFENNSKRQRVFLYKTSDFCGELIPKSNEGKNFWVSKEELENLNTASTFIDTLQIFTDSNTNELFLMIKVTL